MATMTDIEQYRALLGGGEQTKQVMSDMNTYVPGTPNYEKWTGKVVDNDDPERLGRVKIRVIGYYENLEDEWLPWAIPDVSFIGGKCGSQVIPEVGTMVRGYFEKGDVQRPVFNGIAFNQYNSYSRMGLTGRQNKSEYPHKMVLMETDQGDFLTLNRKSGELVFTHRTGAMTCINKNGDIEIYTGNQMNPKGNLNVKVYGNSKISTDGNCEIFAGGDAKIDAAGYVDLGSNQLKHLVANVEQCYICGAMLHVGNTNVRA